jgi:hypothetical protein
MEPLQLPAPATVSSIEGTISGSWDPATDTNRGSVTITDPRHIQRVIELLGTLNSDMSVGPHTFPTPSHTLVFTDSGGVNLLVFVGSNWVGGRNNVEGRSDNRSRVITPEQRSELLRVVGIKDRPQ